MEDISEEPVLDIDSGDKRNPLAVVEYIDDIYAYYEKVEVVHNFHYTCFPFFLLQIRIGGFSVLRTDTPTFIAEF